jgi:hypothetical protein
VALPKHKEVCFLKTELKLLIVADEKFRLKLQDNWNDSTKKFNRKASSFYTYKGIKTEDLIIQPRLDAEPKEKKVTAVFPKPKYDLNKIIGIAREKIGPVEPGEIMIIGNIITLKPFLPRDPHTSSRYQPLININADWGLLIKNAYKLDDLKFIRDLINELAFFIWNFDKEVSPNGRLYLAKKKYEGTWRDPWTKDPCHY